MDYEFAAVIISVCWSHILSAKGCIFLPFSYIVKWCWSNADKGRFQLMYHTLNSAVRVKM